MYVKVMLFLSTPWRHTEGAELIKLKAPFGTTRKAPTKYRIIRQQDIENVSLKRNVE
jgi:hypothetical protein